MRWSKYILFMVMLFFSITIKGQYNPTNPAEPGATYTLTLKSTPVNGGTFNISSVTSCSPGTSVRLRAYNNNNFTFKCWEENGVVVSTSSQFDYVMPSKATTLTAHFEYNPSNPEEPSVPVIPEYRAVYLSTYPGNSGSFNINSGNKYEVGSTVYLYAYNNSNYIFRNWTENGEIISTSASFNYKVKDTDAHLVANFEYSPDNPAEPSEPRLSHKLNLQCNPSGSGFFNISSGNLYQEGTSVYLCAYSNQYYIFQNWSVGNTIVSTDYNFSYVMPTTDVTLTANYIYNYDPDNPNEPGGTDPHAALYGMTESVIKGQQVLYPIFLENTSMQAKGFFVDVKFPAGFQVDKDAIVISGRGTDHELAVTDLGDNNYRLSVSGKEPLSDNNGKVLDIPVTVPSDVEMGKTYLVDLTHGVVVTMDDSQIPVSVRDGGLLVEKISEDGLYSRFSFDKYQNRVKFTNLSSDKAVRFEWDFGDGTRSAEVSPMHIYTESGMYTVKLTVYGESGSDVAELSVLVNDESNWKAQGTYNLNPDVAGVRSFSSLDELFNMLRVSAITGDLRIVVESGQSFLYDLTDTNLETLAQISQALASGGYTLSFEKSGSLSNPLIQFGQDMTSYSQSAASVLFALGKSLEMQDVELRLWGFLLDFSELRQIHSQKVSSGSATVPVDFSLISPDLTYKWTLDTSPSVDLDGYENSGEGILPSMDIVNNGERELSLSYKIDAYYQKTLIYSFNYNIAVTPVLMGELTDCFPGDGEVIPTTSLTLTWNKIPHATYDVYIWNTKNEIPVNPIVANLKDTCYALINFCQYGSSYSWIVKAKNDYQEISSDTMTFRIGKQYLVDDMYTVILPDSDVTFDGSTHEARISRLDGMGEAVFTYTNHGMEEILPTAPVNPGQYDVYLEIAEGELYYGKERTLVGTFTIYQFDETEWHLLQNLCSELDGYGWKEPWNISLGIQAVSTFDGLQIRQGHIVGIDLEGQGLFGTFPTGVLAFPQLETINLSGNHLSGNLSAILTETVVQNPDLTAGITALDVSRNNYQGNIGTLAQCFPDLTALDCSYNSFEDLSPVISSHVVDLNIKSQKMDRIVELDMSKATIEDVTTKMPGILFYNHEQQAYQSNFNILCTTADTDSIDLWNNTEWVMQVSYKDGRFYFPYVYSQNEYYGNSGDTINVLVLNQYDEIEGSTFKIKLLFDKGDANFIDGVDASDLQATILYAFGDYKEYPFNFTAADTYSDHVVNVQDVVSTVNILLSNPVRPILKGRLRMTQDDCSETDAFVYVQNGNVMLNTRKPIAVIDVKANGKISWDMEKLGMIQSVKGANLVAYSLSGKTIPTGETVIGTCDSSARIMKVSLADNEANAVTVSVGNGETTSISDISVEDDQNFQIYDLSGYQRDYLQKGINIVNKKGWIVKIIIK